VLWRLRYRVLPLAWYEMLLGLRSASGLTLLGVCLLVGLVVGARSGMTPAAVSYQVGRMGAIMLGFLCLPLMAGAARRDQQTLASDVVQSRPHQAHDLLLSRFLGNLGVALCLLVALAIFTFGAQAALAGSPPPGAGPKIAPMALIDGILAGALPLVVLCALGYCAGDLLQNTLSAAIIALYWILVLLGRDYLSRIFDFSLSQNAAVYLLLSGGIVAASMAVARYRQGLSNARRINVPLVAAALLVSGLLLAVRFVLTRHDPPMSPHPLAQQVASQSIRSGRLPGFWLNDQHGERIALSNYEGKCLVVGFWSPGQPDAAHVLGAWQRIHEEYGDKGVQVVAVCLSDDWSAGARFARSSRLSYPVVTDTGTHWAENLEDSSPLAEAYEISSLPCTMVADRNRYLVQRLEAQGQAQYESINYALKGLLGTP